MKALLLLFFVSFPQRIFSQLPNVAIIGGGIGGTSCAYFLKELFQNKVGVTLFERDEVGGRLKVMEIGGYKYEAGGSIIHSRNEYMVRFSKFLDLGIRQPHSSKLGIYNGEKFVFEESDWYLYSIANIFWNYGLSMFYMLRDVKLLLNDFARIYSLQDKGYAFTSVDRLLDSMNPSFPNMTRKTIANILQEKGYSERFLHELVQSVMMVNYGQTNNISGFVGYVSLAGAENNLWSVEGGNKLIAEELLKLSMADFIKANVLEITLLPDETFSVKYQESAANEPIKSHKYDFVVLCTPLIKSHTNIKFVNFRKNFQQYERTYHQTVSTFVKGALNPRAFNRDRIPDEILTYNNSLDFNSISKNYPIENVKYRHTKAVYKIFSQKPLSQETVEKLFKHVDVIKEKVWLAYPHYKPSEKLVPFVLYPRLYYANAIELSASAIEMSVVSAKNVALLISNVWKNTVDKIDPHKPEIKDEL